MFSLRFAKNIFFELFKVSSMSVLSFRAGSFDARFRDKPVGRDMGLDTLTLLSRNEVKDVFCWTDCAGKKVKWIWLSATFLLFLLLVVLTVSLALVKLGASTTYAEMLWIQFLAFLSKEIHS